MKSKTYKNTLTIKLFLCAFLLFLGTNTQAQFFKNLAKKAEKAAERAIERKTEQKSQKTTEKAFDDVFNSGNKKSKKKKQKNSSKLPSTYKFNWKYSLKMSSKRSDVILDYYLNNNTANFANKTNSLNTKETQNMLMVFDFNLKSLIMLMDYSGNRFGQIMKMDEGMLRSITELNEKEENSNEYTIKKIGTKTILGKECQGYLIESDEYVAKSYILLNSPVSFKGFSQSNSKNLPRGFNKEWLKHAENGLLMEMKLTHKTKEKRNMTMTCIALEKKNITIKTSEYRLMQL